MDNLNKTIKCCILKEKKATQKGSTLNVVIEVDATFIECMSFFKQNYVLLNSFD